MKKSVYSLVLNDSVVEAVDRLAYSMNTSRSNLINQILAEKVAFETPEQRMREVFLQMERMLNTDSVFQLAEQASAAMMTVKTALRYKYRPTVRYSVELFSSGGGELRVSFRTKSEAFSGLMGEFFVLWIQLENKYERKRYPAGVPCRLEDGKYIRGFSRPSENITNEEMGKAISGYISVLDRVLKAYVEAPEGREVQNAVNAYLTLSDRKNNLI